MDFLIDYSDLVGARVRVVYWVGKPRHLVQITGRMVETTLESVTILHRYPTMPPTRTEILKAAIKRVEAVGDVYSERSDSR